MHQHLVNILFVFLLLSLSLSSYALPSDNDKVINVVANSADLSQQNHKGVYTGNVEFNQGSTNLHAASAVTEGNLKNQLVLAVAKGENGNQAHYWTLTDINKPPLHAYADVIKYYPVKHLIELIGNARIEQGKNSFSAAKISYDTQEQHVVSESNGSTRTTIVIYPEKAPS